jgi:hypothetical protein
MRRGEADGLAAAGARQDRLGGQDGLQAGGERDHRRGVVAAHVGPEGLVLDEQRLAALQRVPRRVALGHPAQLLGGVPLDRHVGVLVERQVAGERVGGEHPALAEDPRAPALGRREPVDLAVERRAGAQAAGDEHEVLVRAAHPVRGLGGDDLDGRGAEPAHQVEVVGGEVLDHADVLDAVGERPDALGGDREDLAERVDVLERGEQRGVVALDVADGAADAGALDGGDDRAASSAVEASGFSTSTLAPAAVSCSTAPTCSSVGTATTAKSGAGPAASSASIDACSSSGSRSAPNRSPPGSTAPANVTLALDCRMRAW